MKFRSTFVLLLSAVAVAGLAFGPLASTPENTGQQLDDGKFRALQRGELTVPGDTLEVGVTVDAEESAVPAPVPCTSGFAGPYTCENFPLASLFPVAEFGGAGGADSWGWTSPDGDEIAIMGTDTGTTFVDVTDPTVPIVLGQVVTESKGASPIWRDVKVINDHAVIVSEDAGHGMQVFDLTRLADEGGVSAATTFEPDAVYSEFSSAHNVAVNDDTDYAYAVGTDTCSGGLHMIDMSDPKAPEFVGCFDEDGYTHDVQCVLYAGPDDDHNGSVEGEAPHEICFASNTDTVTIVDVTDKDNPEQLSRIGYTTAGYTHQGWLTPDQRWFVFNDELDEQRGNVDNTTTYVLDVEDLDLGSQPMGDREGLVTSYAHETISTDHNLYVTPEAPDLGASDELVWEANYNAGLQVLSYTEGADGLELATVGSFDIDSVADFAHYGDAWNVYPFFDSGTVIVSNIAQGLFVLRPDHEALTAGSDG